MLIKFYGSLAYLGEVNLQANSIREVFALLTLQFGEEIITSIIQNPYHYILQDSFGENPQVILTKEVFLTEFTGYDILLVIPEIEGSGPLAAIVVEAIGLVGTAAIVAEVVINIAFAIALNMLMSAISPTPEFSSDPAYSQNRSNLFNGAPILREQGGSVPLIFGNPYCGAVLISSGLTSEEI